MNKIPFIISIILFLSSCDAEPYQLLRREAYYQDQAVRHWLVETGRYLDEENPAGIHNLADTAGRAIINADTSCTAERRIRK